MYVIGGFSLYGIVLMAYYQLICQYLYSERKATGHYVSAESIIPVCVYVSIYVNTDIECNNNHAEKIKENILC